MTASNQQREPEYDGRVLTFKFRIPFDGGPADVCERMIRERITHSLLNSLSSIHPDVHSQVFTEKYVGS